MKTRTPEEIVEYYEDRLGEIIQPYQNQFSVCCPFHEDNKPSLSINTRNGLWTCHGGCGSGNLDQFEKRYVDEGIGDPLFDRKESQAAEERIYSYEESVGKESYQIVRRDFANGEKKFTSRHSGPGGNWINNMKDVTRIPYKLPEMLSSDVIVVCEGEKCVEAVCALNLSEISGKTTSATTTAFGAAGWKKSYVPYFTNKTVIILPDNDETGRGYAEKIAQSIAEVATEVRVVTLPGVPGGGDIVDYIQIHGSNTAKELLACCENTPIYKLRVAKPAFVSLAEFYDAGQDQIEWLVDGLLLTESISLVVAKPKVGKSVLVRQLAVAVAKGESWLGRRTKQGHVIYIGLEDSAQLIRRHFRDLGADASLPIQIALASEHPTMEKLESLIKAHSTTLVVIDPLFRFCHPPAKADYSEMLKVFDPLLSLCRRLNVHVCATHHLKKAQEDEMFDNILGSTAIFGSVETAIGLRSTPTGERVICSQQRYGTNLELSILEFDLAKRASTLGGTVSDAELMVQAGKAKQLEEAICEYVKLHPGCTGPEIEHGVGGKTLLVRSAVNSLKSSERGVLGIEGNGKKGDPFRYYYVEDIVVTLMAHTESHLAQTNNRSVC